jgi:hypothetical protein
MRSIQDPVDLLQNSDDIVLKIERDGGLDLVLSTGVQAVAQEIRIKLDWLRGEWEFDPSLGVPYFENLLGQKFNESTIRQEINAQLLSVEGVKTVDRLNVFFNRATRTVEVQFLATTIFGDTINATTAV